MKKKILILGIVLGLLLILAACTPAAAPTVPVVDEPTCPEAAPCPAPLADAPFTEMWATSGHADAEAEAFRHWDGDDPAEMPVACAKCHAGAGLVEFLATGKNETAIAAETIKGIDCVSCHNEASSNYTAVTFPSGVVIDGLGREALCMTCHQGRESKVSVDAQIEKFAIEDLDAVVAPIKDDAGNDVRFGFRNVHYFAAAATLFGSEVHGGYEYDGNIYDWKNDHIKGYSTCTDCHDSHSLEVKVDQCATCHEGVVGQEDLKKIRMVSSSGDYDGDGDIAEGMAFEIEGLQTNLLSQLQTYAKDKTGAAIVYDPAAYPYWFADADGDGAIDQKDGANISFSTWTARLLKAAYNYQVSVKDPGAYAHGNKYIVQLLFDSIKDLGGDVSKLARTDAGHFAGDTEAFRHWDAEGEVPAACVKCHTAEGLPQFIENAANLKMEPSNGFSCYTCHDHANWPSLYTVADVTFPSGAKLTFGEGDASNSCLQCHQGRESSVSVGKVVAGLDADTPSEKISFRNVHYFAAGATLFGTEAKGVYEYPGMTYLGKFEHVEGFATCTNCHDAHGLEVKVETCKGCHGTEDVAAIRAPGDTTDYDGDGDTTEGIHGEIETMKEKLYTALQAYAKDTLKAGIIYNPVAYPYYFPDVDNNGEVDKDADGKNLSIKFWSPRLLEGAYNYQYAMKDPGAASHNGKYVIQVLYDSIKDLGGSVVGMTRP